MFVAAFLYSYSNSLFWSVANLETLPLRRRTRLWRCQCLIGLKQCPGLNRISSNHIKLNRNTLSFLLVKHWAPTGCLYHNELRNELPLHWMTWPDSRLQICCRICLQSKSHTLSSNQPWAHTSASTCATLQRCSQNNLKRSWPCWQGKLKRTAKTYCSEFETNYDITWKYYQKI